MHRRRALRERSPAESETQLLGGQEEEEEEGMCPGAVHRSFTVILSVLNCCLPAECFTRYIYK